MQHAPFHGASIEQVVDLARIEQVLELPHNPESHRQVDLSNIPGVRSSKGFSTKKHVRPGKKLPLNLTNR